MTLPDDITPQRFIAGQLPEVIRESECFIHGVPIFRWLHDSYEVRPTEWLHLVRLVEEKLTDEEYGRYGQERMIMAKVRHPKNNIHAGRYTLSMSWSDCATALQQVMKGGKE